MCKQKVVFDAQELSEVFFDIYLRMFFNENLKENMAQPNMSMAVQTFSRYSCLSFATLMQHAMRHIETSWDVFYNFLGGKVANDETLHMGGELLEDYIHQLHLLEDI